MQRFIIATLAICGCVPIITIDTGDSSADSSGADSSTEGASASGSVATSGQSSGSADSSDSTEASTGNMGGSSEGASSSTTGDACGDLPGAYEACNQACADPWACADAQACVYNEPGGTLAHCTTNCQRVDDCPPSPFPEPWSAYCDLGLCWIDCAYDTPGPVCPDGYTCWDMEIAGHRATCMPSAA